MKKIGVFVAAAAALLCSGAAMAQPDWAPRHSDPRGYYSDYDHNGYYDQYGRYRRFDWDRERDDDDYDRDHGYDRGDSYDEDSSSRYYYREGDYENNCRRGNAAAGTIFGALAGGLIGNAASHGGAGATVGGVILGGILGNTIARDIPCEDHRYAFRVYADGLNGPIGRRYDWRNEDNDDYGYFTPTREFNRGGYVCREFREVTYRDGRTYERSGSACRQTDGNWRFD